MTLATPSARPGDVASVVLEALNAGAPDLSTVQKLAEIPFDFVRKRVSVIVDAAGKISPHHKGRVSSRA